jgi:hypothetical protein
MLFRGFFNLSDFHDNTVWRTVDFTPKARAEISALGFLVRLRGGARASMGADRPKYLLPSEGSSRPEARVMSRKPSLAGAAAAGFSFVFFGFFASDAGSRHGVVIGSGCFVHRPW